MAVIACFLIGVVIAGGLVRLGHAGDRVGAIGWLVDGLRLRHRALGRLLLAFAMGTQNGAVTRFGDATLNTVFITGDLQKLFEAVLGWLWQSKDGQPPPGFAILAPVWLEYFAGALLGSRARRPRLSAADPGRTACRSCCWEARRAGVARMGSSRGDLRLPCARLGQGQFEPRRMPWRKTGGCDAGIVEVVGVSEKSWEAGTPQRWRRYDPRPAWPSRRWT